MKLSYIKGLTFGLTSGIITTLGLMVGLNSSTGSTLAVIGGILIIAISDALSDAFGMHISEESEAKHTPKEIWESTLATFLSKFIFACTFIVPVLMFPLNTAMLVSIAWGMLLITVLSYIVGKDEKQNTFLVVGEHLGITIFVVLVANYTGLMIASVFA
ncbi:MAG: hypothetical protein JW789_00840 [Candidatus Aenigmarchaeota archaeon]|nr:hypothetical protein [Candidatus Aenigmarchaeota archaeon]